MAKKQSFGDKVRQRRQERVVMAKVVMAQKKPNGHYRFREKIVPASEVSNVVKAAQ